MQFKIYPNKRWYSNDNYPKEIDLYKKISKNYNENDLIFKIIKKDGRIKNLSFIELKSNSLKLANLIKLKTKKSINQTKIFSVINASEDSIYLMLASLFLSGNHCICFEELSEAAIAKRIEIFQPDLICCRNNEYKKLKKAIELIDYKIKEIILINKEDYCKRKDLNGNIENIGIYKKESKLFTLFTSGSTGTPKSVSHGPDTYFDYAEYTSRYYFGLGKGKIIYTATDAGWINGHTYAFYGPLLCGSISVINESPLNLSIPRFLADYLGELQVDCFYTSVTMLRLIKSLTKNGTKINDLTKNNVDIERIGSCGEPLAHDIGAWGISFFQTKRKNIVNTYFQTETGGILIAPRDEDGISYDYSTVGKCRNNLKINTADKLLNPKELKEENIDPNELFIYEGNFGIFKEIESDKKSNYFSSKGFYRLNDIGFFDKEGFLYIGGRSDDVINVSGHRLSTSETESICLRLDEIQDVCAVAKKDPMAGDRIVLFISMNKSLKPDEKNIREKLNSLIIKELTSYHKPKEIYLFKGLPKTRSGKIMRRLMKILVNDKKIDIDTDYSTLANIDEFMSSANSFLKKLN